MTTAGYLVSFLVHVNSEHSLNCLPNQLNKLGDFQPVYINELALNDVLYRSRVTRF